ncbi:MAG: F0F1 ATP synthase subunit B [Flavobacteriales bacterium]|nr:F0F1 ATP synthase subunit B [Flavobacteriales bacterium]
MDKLLEQFSLGLFFWQTLIFIALLIILKKYAWKPILDAVNKREETIKGSLEEAKLAREELKNLTIKNDKIIKEAKMERDAILRDARELKEKVIAESKEVAREEADKIIAAAKVSINNEKMSAITELKNQVASVSIDIAEKVLNQELSNKKSQQELVEKLVKQTNLN